ncbi:cation:proton antiporter [Lentilactobacillus sp. SPB1-3]|uniref:Cation:proton antiporter n=1 Tax=Lentilactobacillus terminaliae TaxID=3003483 RepID=A0ACD5DDU3_9LACO|nr:sodium:proton antiporter [Lentilactobacillus sp. SPB1-3]MCZ0977459.1 sodium:proton antiporter [Lentilactobacillus sp. SPB1-3]
MDQVLLIIIILAGVVLANILANHITIIPLPFFLIGIGIIFAILPFYRGFVIDPATFSLAIISPLLYNEAQNSSRLWIGRSIVNILSLAVGLVLVSVLVVGTGLHWLFPVLPLSLSFALMAVVTPTDASAVNSIFESSPIAKEQMGILQNESLFNDAAGIVLFDVALGAYMSGSFSVNYTILIFLWEFIGGLIFGALVGVAIVSARLFLIRNHDDTPIIMVPIQILTPFLVYLLADKFGMSGILAVVAAGLAQGSERGKLRLTSSRMQIVTSNVWEVISGMLSGIVFILLGLSLPTVIQAMHYSAQSEFAIWRLLLIGVALYIAQLVVRLLWSHFLLRTDGNKERSWRDSLIMALSGAHGTITLSLAFSMPLMINGGPFIFRSPLIFLAAVIIIISLIMPTVLIPLLVPTQSLNQPRYKWVKRMIQAAISDLVKEKENVAAAQIVIDSLQQQLVLDGSPSHRVQRQITKEAYDVERKAIQQMHDDGKITDDELKYYFEFLELNNFSADNKIWKNVWLRIRFGLHMGKMYKDLHRAQDAFLTAPIELEEVYWRQQFKNHGEDILPIEKAGFDAVMEFLKDHESDHGMEVNFVRRFYRTRHRRVNSGDVDPDIVYQMFMRAFHSEYELIQEALSSKQIDSDLAERLQQRISFDEITYIQNSEMFREQI